MSKSIELNVAILRVFFFFNVIQSYTFLHILPKPKGHLEGMHLVIKNCQIRVQFWIEPFPEHLETIQKILLQLKSLMLHHRAGIIPMFYSYLLYGYSWRATSSDSLVFIIMRSLKLWMIYALPYTSMLPKSVKWRVETEQWKLHHQTSFLF